MTPKPYDRVWKVAGPDRSADLVPGWVITDRLLHEPLHRRKSTVYSVWFDLFHPDIPDSHIDRVKAVQALCPQHTFQVQTEHSGRMRAVMTRISEEPEIIWQHHIDLLPKNRRHELDGFEPEWPLPNLHLYVTPPDQASAEAMVPDLLATPAAVRGVEIRGMRGRVDLTPFLPCPKCRGRGWYFATLADAFRPGSGNSTRCLDCVNRARSAGHEVRQDQYARSTARLDHVILSGGADPVHPDWVRKVRDDCKAAGVGFWFEGWGEWAPLEGSEAGYPTPCKFWNSTRVGIPDGWINGVSSEDTPHVVKVGKRRAGRVLDGVEHSERVGVRG